MRKMMISLLLVTEILFPSISEGLSRFNLMTCDGGGSGGDGGGVPG